MARRGTESPLRSRQPHRDVPSYAAAGERATPRLETLTSHHPFAALVAARPDVTGVGADQDGVDERSVGPDEFGCEGRDRSGPDVELLPVPGEGDGDAPHSDQGVEGVDGVADREERVHSEHLVVVVRLGGRSPVIPVLGVRNGRSGRTPVLQGMQVVPNR
jgi:hypothetical protein